MSHDPSECSVTFGAIWARNTFRIQNLNYNTAQAATLCNRVGRAYMLRDNIPQFGFDKIYLIYANTMWLLKCCKSLLKQEAHYAMGYRE